MEWPELMKPSTAAKYCDLSRKTIWRLRVEGKLKAVEPLSPGEFMFRRVDLDAFIQRSN